jgi:hypothetical protein
MAKNVDHIQHIKSNVVLEGKPKLPESSNLVEGELAINYADGVETISIKNSNGDIVTFSSDEYYSKQKLGSAFTDTNSAVTVTEYLEENELIVSTALSGKSDVNHVHGASGVTNMAGYEIASSASDILTTDSLLQVIGKLEKRIKILELATGIQSNGDAEASAGEYE